jgi:hypothetical protein
MRKFLPTLASLLAVSLIAAPAMAVPKLGSLSDAEVNQAIEQIKTDPSYIAKNRDLSYQLTLPQWDAMIRGLDLNHFTWLHPVITKGKELPAVLNKSIEDLSVMSVHRGKLLPIPFQIDEKDKEGWVYVKSVSKNGIDGSVDILDDNDEVVFMYRDSGSERLPKGLAPEGGGEILQEMTFTHEGTTRYAYLVSGSTARDASDYVNYDEKTFTADTTFYTFRQDPKNLLIFKDFRAHAGRSPEHRVLDAVCLDISTGVISPWPRVTVGIENLQVELLGVKHGAVREFLMAKLVVVIAGIPVFYIRADFTVYDQGLSLPVKLSIPGGEILTRILNKPIINLGLDLNDMRGGKFVAAVDPSGQHGAVDGVVSDIEKQMNVVPPDKIWMWLESSRGWDVIFNVVIPTDWPIEGKLLYEDSEKPEVTYDVEDFPGALPRMGVTVNKLPVGKLNIDLTAEFWFPDTVGKAGPVPFIKEMKNPPMMAAGKI